MGELFLKKYDSRISFLKKSLNILFHISYLLFFTYRYYMENMNQFLSNNDI